MKINLVSKKSHRHQKYIDISIHSYSNSNKAKLSQKVRAETLRGTSSLTELLDRIIFTDRTQNHSAEGS